MQPLLPSSSNMPNMSVQTVATPSVVVGSATAQSTPVEKREEDTFRIVSGEVPQEQLNQLRPFPFSSSLLQSSTNSKEDARSSPKPDSKEDARSSPKPNTRTVQSDSKRDARNRDLTDSKVNATFSKQKDTPNARRIVR